MKTKRSRRDPYSRMVVRLPERDLAESILDLAAPLLEPLGPAAPADEVRRALDLVIKLWNAHVTASLFWGNPKPRSLADLRKAMCRKEAAPGLAETFEALSAQYRKKFDLDPRLVADWSFDAGADGRHRLVCRMTLPDGVEAHVDPPKEKRIAIGGKFLDEVQIRQSETSSLSFPYANHSGEVGPDGVVTIRTKMPTAVQLFAARLLSPVGGAPTEVAVGGKVLGPMVLAEVRCPDEGGRHDVAVLVFRRADSGHGASM